MKMSTDSQVISKAITSAALILAVAVIFSANLMKPKSGRYTFTGDLENWVIVGDTRTGRSWRCLSTSVFDESVDAGAEIPKGFDSGCFAISVPSKVQKMNSYEGTM